MKMLVLLILSQFIYALELGKVDEGFRVEADQRLIKEIQAFHPELTIDHIENDSFELYGPVGTGEWLSQIKAKFYSLDEQPSFDWFKKTNYPSFENLEEFLIEIAANNPHIMQLISIGKSVEGRDLWVMKISDNVERDELEPEFKYISSMHGNEITGRELTRELVKDIAAGYGVDKRITRLVDQSELYIMPSMNPDGSENKKRGNANGYDLNRNFPNWVKGEPNSVQGRQPETVAIMNFQKERHFALSANFHGGAVVVNYPWDSSFERHPLDKFLQDLSLSYAQLNPEMKGSTSFRDGITNGADWYVLSGGMQDWSYIWHNDLQITIELSDNKWPRYSKIPDFYHSNKESMLTFAENIYRGFGIQSKGFSRVKILQDGKDLGRFEFTDEFYKVLPAGSYQLKIENERGNYKRKVTIAAGGQKTGKYLKL